MGTSQGQGLHVVSIVEPVLDCRLPGEKGIAAPNMMPTLRLG